MRSTFVTLWAIVGTMARKVGFYADDNGVFHAVYKGYKGAPELDPSDVELWALDSTVDHAVEYLLQSDAGDGRHSAAQVGAYSIPVEYLTGKDGTLYGKWNTLAERACYLLNTSDAVYKGETYDDRLDDLVGITNQLDW
jgi:hypothetical protein